MEIRPAIPADVPAMVAIYGYFIEHTAVSFEVEVPSVEEFTQRVATIQKEYPWLVCVVDGHVAGYAYASEHRSRASYRFTKEVSVYMDSEFRGKGIARKLYEAVFELLRPTEVHTVLAGMTEPNPASRAFHTSMGFSLVGTYSEVGQKFGKWHDVSWYERRL